MKLTLRGLLGRLASRRPDPVDVALERARQLAGPRPVEAQFPPQPTVLIKVPGYVPEEPWADSERWRPSDGYVGCGDDVAAAIDDTYCTPDPNLPASSVDSGWPAPDQDGGSES